MKVPAQAKKVFSGIIFDTYQWEQELPNGTTQTFEMIKRPATVVVIALVKDKILLLQEEQPVYGTFVGVPGGRIEENETPEQSAHRELLEETGHTGTLNHWFTSETPGKIEWEYHCFIAKDCKKVAEQNLDLGEKIKPFFISVDEFLKMIRTDEFRDTKISEKILADVSGFEKLIQQ